MSKLFFYDLETTGTNPGRNGIHQISGEIVIDGKSVETFDFKVQPNPKAQVEDAALAVGGVTREQIMAYPPMGQVYTQLVTMLAKYVNKYDKTDKFHLVGYNNRGFDVTSFADSSCRTATITSGRGFGRIPSTCLCLHRRSLQTAAPNCPTSNLRPSPTSWASTRPPENFTMRPLTSM